ncbi:MAG: SDR family oxidoreductase [Actinobacteria bacterium]|nr:SDR family oxidoreductase [Actinomycetota bacterium]NIS31756.1 SDR family oxidoreductase [Actinomycetota bacterium]NIT95866.1 SDR family oxidoreductase [Actinomycetota bacterium]NIU19542.1 SDR family oxidoreductase [Actinomycetota bacterium]NIU66853.1 SDR family oxidoreductase [Actinomycetota bacterium]
MTRFTDRTVIVTGASRGIGAATAEAFAAEGARVAINYRSDEDGARATKAAIAAAGGTAEVFRADVGVVDDVDRLVADVRAAFGPVSILVNNAAMIDRSSFLDVSLDDFEAVWHVNVRGVYQLSQRIAADMIDEGIEGVIVHLSSILARLAIPNRTAYITSKGAIEGLTRAMALDLAPHGIRVNAVAPGLVATEALLAGMPDPDLQAAIQSYIPGGRFGRPEELMAAILFAASPEASYVNGTVLSVDAGLGAKEAGPP